MIEKIESSSNCNTGGVNSGSGDDTSVRCHHQPPCPGQAPVLPGLPLSPPLADIFPRPAVTPDLHYLIINATAAIPLTDHPQSTVIRLCPTCPTDRSTNTKAIMSDYRKASLGRIMCLNILLLKINWEEWATVLRRWQHYNYYYNVSVI